MAGAVVESIWVDVAGRAVRLNVLELGLACCGIEVREARRAADLAGALAGLPGSGRAPGAGPSADAGASPELDVLVVAGTVTTALAPVLSAAWAALPEPRAVLAFGACAATGGPYWDSYAVLPGAHEVVPVTAWVAGCPPRPEDLHAGLLEVLRARD
jgi:NADH-quinone oxidoreductase subunit B